MCRCVVVVLVFARTREDGVVDDIAEGEVTGEGDASVDIVSGKEQTGRFLLSYCCCLGGKEERGKGGGDVTKEDA